ncbi:molybdopterin-binding protein [Bacillaceae bacterium]
MKKPVLREVPVEQAVGMVLPHDLTKIIPGEFKGRAFKKGHVIRPEDVEELKNIGKEHIYILEIPDGYLHENEAALRIARAIAGQNLAWDEPHEGKVTLKATQPGLTKIDKERVYAINAIGDLALATVLANRPVAPGQPVAGTRAIPLLIEEEKICRVEAIAAEKPIIEVVPLQKKRVGIVTTGNEVYSGRIEDKFGPVVKRKVEQLGSTVIGQRFAPDDVSRIQQEIRALLAAKADLILVTGGMSVDPDDRTPGAIKGLGAEIVSYGTPMLPGSMLLIAYLDDTPVMGLPGCVMHDPFTSFDVFLPRILAGERIRREDVIEIGYGGYHTC